MQRPLALATAALLLFPTARAAHAAGPDICVPYANAMTAMTVRGQKAKCNTFASTPLDWDNHFNWCSSQGPAKIKEAEDLWSAKLDGCLLSSAQPTPQPAPATPRGKPIVNALSGKCMVAADGVGGRNGVGLVIWNCNDSRMNAANRWELTNGGFIRNVATGKCVDVSGAPGTADGSALLVWDCESSGRNPNGSVTDQRWELRGGFIVNELSRKCVDVSGAPGTADGAKLLLWTCESSGRNPNGSATDQNWRF
ncbi:RICIN domain-containing protein [Xanthobacter variabilis]|uniref:RICIN domain-containing protein n=1 Tax=Xanthobacter variabilis TaxID=3119932 RepID=UPI00374EA10E